MGSQFNEVSLIQAKTTCKYKDKNNKPANELLKYGDKHLQKCNYNQL